jgi:hypothetical protein
MQCFSCSLILGMWSCWHQLRTRNITQSENVWYGLQQSKQTIGFLKQPKFAHIVYYFYLIWSNYPWTRWSISRVCV